MSREAVIEREEKLLDRIDALMARHSKQAEQTLEHTLKVFGHDIAEQLQTMRNKIHAERDQRLAEEVGTLREEARKAEAAAPAKPAENPFRAYINRNWVWIGAIVAIIIVLRPDLAMAAVRAVF